MILTQILLILAFICGFLVGGKYPSNYIEKAGQIKKTIKAKIFPIKKAQVFKSRELEIDQQRQAIEKAKEEELEQPI